VPGPRRRRILVAPRGTAAADRPRVEAGPADVDADRHGPAPVRRPQGGLALLGLADEEEFSGDVVAGAADGVADEPSGEVLAEAEPAVDGSVADEPVGDEQVDGRVDDERADDARVNDERADDARVNDERVGDGRVDGGRVGDGRVGDGRVDDERVDQLGESASGEQPGDELADEPDAEPGHARGVEPAHTSPDERAGELAPERVAEFAEERAADLADEGAQDQPIAKAQSVASVAGRNEPEDRSRAVTRFGTVASPTGGVAPRVDRYGDRIDGWIRPQYREQYEPGGEYWTPVPESSYADAGYGWPVPVERLPPVPPYPPHSGFDHEGFDPEPVDEPEPTAVVPQWPPAKPPEPTDPLRTWTDRNTKSPRVEAALDWVARDRTPAVRDEAALDWIARDRNTDGRTRRGAVMMDRRPLGGSADTEMLPAVNETAPRRRPRPRPSPPDSPSTVYRSRHAADPG
jgi:hypothetical protein